MIDAENEDARYSICIVFDANQDKAKPFYKYYRVADYNLDENANRLDRARVSSDGGTDEEKLSNPDWLFNPLEARHYSERESDFCLLLWSLDNTEDTVSRYDDTELPTIGMLREVIIPEHVNGEEDLRRALAEGIPFAGKTTESFFLVYKREKDILVAIKCKRSDYVFTGGSFKLATLPSDIRHSTINAPIVRLDSMDIIESPHSDTNFRKLYARLEDPDEDGYALLRPIGDYAADYVKWFIKEENIEVAKADKKLIAPLIETALMRPDALEHYLGGNSNEDEALSLVNAIETAGSNLDDSTRALVRNALLADDSVREECIKQVIRENDERITEKRAALQEAEVEVSNLKSELSKLQIEIGNAKARRLSIDMSIDEKESEYEEIVSSKDAVLDELRDNAAVMIGLRAVADGCASGPLEKALSVLPSLAVKGCGETDKLVKALENNMRRLGVVGLNDTSDERHRAALSIVGALDYAQGLAMPDPVATSVADALCVALSGLGAKRIFVPADYDNLNALLAEIDCPEPVVVLSNVLDSVNESMLFALLAADIDKTIVFSFTSYESLGLIAKEVWERLFFPRVGLLARCSRSARPEKVVISTEKSGGNSIAFDEICMAGKDLCQELGQDESSLSRYMLPGAVISSMQMSYSDCLTESLVVQHLAIALKPGGALDEELKKWSQDSESVKMIAEKLGVNGE